MEVFNRPWFGTLFMAIGMSLCLLVYIIRIKINPNYGPNLSSIPAKVYMITALPALFDMLYSLGHSFSIAESSNSILVASQYLSFFFMIILQKVFIRSKFYTYKWISFLIIIIGIIFVCLSQFLYHRLYVDPLTLSLQIFAEFVLAVRGLILEQIMHNNDVSPWVICGLSGVYEIILILFVFYPISFYLPSKNFESLHENFCSSSAMFIHSTQLIILFLTYLVVTALYNVCNIYTIMMIDALFYTIFKMFSGSVIWLCDITIFYAFNGKFILDNEAGKKYGQSWSKLDYLRVIGTVIFLIGGLIFLSVIKFKCFEYPQPNVTTLKMSLSDDSRVISV